MEENKEELKETMRDESADMEKEVRDKIEIQEETDEKSEENGRYTTLAKLEDNLWTYGSPVIFESGVLERDKISQRNLLTLNFTNLDQRIIQEVFVTIFVSDNDGNAELIEHQYSVLGQKYLSKKGSNAKIHIKNEKARNFRIKVDGVKFEDGNYWLKKDAIYESAGSMENIKDFAEAKAKDYEDTYISGREEIAKDDSGSIGNGIELLKRIVWYKNVSELLKDATKKYALAKKNEERKQIREDNLKKRKQAIRKRYIAAGVTVGIIILIAVIAIVAFFIPNKKYKDAKKLLKGGETAKAADYFEDLNGFLKSDIYLAQCYYNIGLAALEKSDEEKALEYFHKSHDADKDSDYGLMAGAYLDYYAGTEALEAKEYEQALTYFKSSTGAATDFNLINKASAGMAQINYIQKSYESAWNTIKNVYAKDTAYQEQYAEYGYAYAKTLVDSGKIADGMEIYNQISKYTKKSNLSDSVYAQAVKLGEQGKISEAMNLLKQIKKGHSKADKLYKSMSSFNDKVQLWLGEWRHTGKVNGEKKTYKIFISQVLYKGEMCLRIKDQNNDYLGFDTVISSKNRVTQIVIGTYQLHFKLKKYHDQKFTFSLQEGNKMERALKYDGKKYKSTYKKKK